MKWGGTGQELPKKRGGAEEELKWSSSNFSSAPLLIRSACVSRSLQTANPSGLQQAAVMGAGDVKHIAKQSGQIVPAEDLRPSIDFCSLWSSCFPPTLPFQSRLIAALNVISSSHPRSSRCAIKTQKISGGDATQKSRGSRQIWPGTTACVRCSRGCRTSGTHLRLLKGKDQLEGQQMSLLSFHLFLHLSVQWDPRNVGQGGSQVL